ncbi:DEP domain-containing mTOR-interacting protein-like isoform X2 [Ptychodera flava]|uniref:DEP domain-containing mTOR-interacting protein-like isoform X2 n=1 Tax=Ptychodera flava TaxID=63121 RepID=UPI00396AA3CD
MMECVNSMPIAYRHRKIVCDDHVFKDEYLFYRFRKDDNSFPKTRVTAVYLKAEKLRLKLFRGSMQHPIVKDIKEDGHLYKQCFSGKDVVDLLVKDKDVKSRKQAVALCKDLVEHGILRHVKDEEDFNDNINQWYQFTDLKHLKLTDLPQLVEERRRSISQGSKGSASSSSPPEVPIKAGYPWNINHSPVPSPSTPTKSGYPWDFNQSVSGHLMVSTNLHARRHSSPMPYHDDNLEDVFQEKLPTNFENDAEWGSERSWSSSGDSVEMPMSAPAVTRHEQNPLLEKLMSPDSPYVRKNIRILSDAVGFGFVVRGTHPTYVQTIDPSSPAAAAGLKVGQYITSVNEISVMHMDHTQVARVILSIPAAVSLTVYEKKK